MSGCSGKEYFLPFLSVCSYFLKAYFVSCTHKDPNWSGSGGRQVTHIGEWVEQWMAAAAGPWHTEGRRALPVTGAGAAGTLSALPEGGPARGLRGRSSSFRRNLQFT